jgi:hypothetical protein
MCHIAKKLGIVYVLKILSSPKYLKKTFFKVGTICAIGAYPMPCTIARQHSIPARTTWTGFSIG